MGPIVALGLCVRMELPFSKTIMRLNLPSQIRCLDAFLILSLPPEWQPAPNLTKKVPVLATLTAAKPTLVCFSQPERYLALNLTVFVLPDITTLVFPL